MVIYSRYLYSQYPPPQPLGCIMRIKIPLHFAKNVAIKTSANSVTSGIASKSSTMKDDNFQTATVINSRTVILMSGTFKIHNVQKRSTTAPHSFQTPRTLSGLVSKAMTTSHCQQFVDVKKLHRVLHLLAIHSTKTFLTDKFNLMRTRRGVTRRILMGLDKISLLIKDPPCANVSFLAVTLKFGSL